MLFGCIVAGLATGYLAYKEYIWDKRWKEMQNRYMNVIDSTPPPTYTITETIVWGADILSGNPHSFYLFSIYGIDTNGTIEEFQKEIGFYSQFNVNPSEYIKIEYYEEGSDSYSSVYGGNLKGQTFTIGTTEPNQMYILKQVRLRIQRVGGDRTLVIRIYNVDAEGFPIGSPISQYQGSTGSITSSEGGGWYTFNMPSPILLSASTKYALVVSVPNGNIDNRINWMFDSTNSLYNGGRLIHYSGQWLENVFADRMFGIIGTVANQEHILKKSDLVSEGISQQDCLTIIAEDFDGSAISGIYDWRIDNSVI